MTATKKPLGFGDTRQAANVFGVTQAEVKRRAQSGDWPSWVIAGRRVFNLDELAELEATGKEGAAE